MSARIDLDRLQASLHTKWLGQNIFFSKAIDSTNDWAKELAKLGAQEGTVAFAETQTAGRGRLNREWVSPKGGLWLSVILRPETKSTEAAKLMFIAGLAVARVLHRLYGLAAEVKWPNDVLVDGKKICGILGETNATRNAVSFVILGIGINANFNVNKTLPKTLRETATSLQSMLGQRVKLEELFLALMEEIEKLYDTYKTVGFSTILGEWKKCAGFLNKLVEVACANERLIGVACDVDCEGALLLKLKDGRMKRILVGDVSFPEQIRFCLK